MPNFKLLLRLSVFLFVLATHSVCAQFIPISLDERVEKSYVILEGKVIRQTTVWDNTRTRLYTLNLVEVYKVFKGPLREKHVEIVTRGGILGDKMERISHTLELKTGDIGIFTCIKNTAKLESGGNFIKFKVFAGLQGFIQYDVTTSKAKDLFNKYNNIKQEVYAKITALTKSEITTIQKAPFEIK